MELFDSPRNPFDDDPPGRQGDAKSEYSTFGIEDVAISDERIYVRENGVITSYESRTEFNIDDFVPQAKVVLEKLDYDTYGVKVLAGMKFLIPVSTNDALSEEEFEHGIEQFVAVNYGSPYIKGKETYFQVNFIGKGASGQVFKCYVPKTDRFVAIKEIIKPAEGSDHARELKHEVDTLTYLSDKPIDNVSKLLDILIGPDKVYLVFELCDPMSDQFVINDAKTAFTCIKTLLTVIKNLRELRVTHFDIKPQNLIICKDAQGRATITLADFGMAEVLDDPKSVFKGSPNFMSPEVITKKPVIFTPDVWGVAATLYYLLYRRTPFSEKGSKLKDTLQRICNLRYTPCSDLPYMSTEENVIVKSYFSRAFSSANKRPTAEEALRSFQEIFPHYGLN